MAGFFSFVPIGFVVFVTFNRVLMRLAERYGPSIDGKRRNWFV